MYDDVGTAKTKYPSSPYLSPKVFKTCSLSPDFGLDLWGASQEVGGVAGVMLSSFAVSEARDVGYSALLWRSKTDVRDPAGRCFRHRSE